MNRHLSHCHFNWNVTRNPGHCSLFLILQEGRPLLPLGFRDRSSSLETKHRNILYDYIRGVSQRLGLLEGFEMCENTVCYLRRFHWGLDRGPVNLYRQNQQKPRLSSEVNCNVKSTVFSRYLKNYIWYSPAKRQKLWDLQKNGCNFRLYYIKLCWLVYVNLIQSRAVWEEGTPIEKMPQSDRSIGKSVGHFLDL